MTRWLLAIERLIRTQDGQDLLEYGLAAALIAIVAVAAVTQVGEVIDAVLWGHIVQNF